MKTKKKPQDVYDRLDRLQTWIESMRCDGLAHNIPNSVAGHYSPLWPTATPQEPPKPPVAPPPSGWSFRNPANGYVEHVGWMNVVGTLLLGPIYLAVKGLWGHALAALVLAPCTCCVSVLVYPLVAPFAFRAYYLRKGWVSV